MWNKESEFGSIFIFWISSISRFLQLIKFSGFFLLDSAVNSLNWLNNNLRFGGGLSFNVLLPFEYFPTDDSFISELLWMNEWKFWLLRFPKGNVLQVYLKQNQGSLLFPLILWKSRKLRWLHLGCIHEFQMSHIIDYFLSSWIVFSHIPHK